MSLPPPPRVPTLQYTLSHVSPDKAAEIRSAVTGALVYCMGTGVYSFENRVETTFVLPWDLNPQVQPQRLSKYTKWLCIKISSSSSSSYREVREGIRLQLLDQGTLLHLESSGAINWSNHSSWQSRPAQGGDWEYIHHILYGNFKNFNPFVICLCVC